MLDSGWKRLHWGDTRIHLLEPMEQPGPCGALLVVDRVTPAERCLLEACYKRSISWFAASEEGADLSLPDWVAKVRHYLKCGLLVAVSAEDLQDSDGTPWPMHQWLPEISAGGYPVVPVSVFPHWGHSQEGGPGRWVPRRTQLHEKRVDIVVGEPVVGPATGKNIRLQHDLLATRASLARKRHNLTAPRLFLRVARRKWAESCFLDGAVATGEMTFGRALTASLLMADIFKNLLPNEEMVGVWMPTGTGGALVNTALALCGRVAINLNYTASQAVNDACLSQTSVKTIITARRFLNRLSFEPGSGRKLLILEDTVGKATGFAKARAYFRARFLPLGMLESWLGCNAQQPDDLATIVFSSGSTGAPKGVELTHGNIVANIQSLIAYGDIFPEDRMLGVLPFFHSFGYTITLWAPLCQGISVAYYPDPRQGRDIGALCRRHASTVMLSTATFLRFCLKRAEVGDFDSVRLLVCGAEKLPMPLAREFSERFGVLPIEGYGCTELSPVSNINLPDLVLANGRKLLRNQPGSVGKMVTGCTCRILDPDTGLSIPDGMPGMIHIAGANVMRGYLGQPGKTAEVVHEGYYRTGDIGYVDERGHIVITGRLSRFAKSGGEMVPLERIEQMLHEELPSTDRVCGVSCVPDQTRGERVVVLFVPETLAEYGIDIKTWLKRLSARGIPPLWIPSERDFLPVPEIPSLGSGKLDLQQLAQMARTLAGSNG